MKVIIEILGGVVSDIVATENIDIFVLDHDNLKIAGESEIKSRCNHPILHSIVLNEDISQKLKDTENYYVSKLNK